MKKAYPTEGGHIRPVRTGWLSRFTPEQNEIVCAVYQHPDRPDKPCTVWEMRRRNVENWTRSVSKHGFKLVGIVRMKRLS